MPYPNAHFYIVGLVMATLLGFWPFYFSDMASAPIAFHFHGISATMWLVLLALQSWSIHNHRVDRHRRLGKASIALFPLFLSGFFLVFQTESQKTALGNPFREVYGPGMGAITVIAIITTAYFYHSSLKNRRNVQLHARYMLAIPFLFAESVFGRILNNFVPGMIVDGVDKIPLVYLGFHLSQLAAIALALFLYFREPRFGRPFLVVSAVMIAQSIALETFDSLEWWRQSFISVAQIPFALTLLVGVSFGILVSWFAWNAPFDRPTRGPAISQ